MSFPYSGVRIIQLPVYDNATDGTITAVAIETSTGKVMQTNPASFGGGGGTTGTLDRVEIGFVNRSTSGWLDIGEPIPPNLEDFEVEVNGVDRNTQSVVEVDVPGERIRVEDSNPFVADLQKVTFTKLV